MGPVKTFLNLQMSILTSLPPLQASAPTPNNKWLLLTVLLVMMPENKQKSINNNLQWKNEPLNKTDTKLSCGKWHLRAWREKEVASVWVEERKRGRIDTKSDPGNENLAGLTCPVLPMQGCNVICRLQLTPLTKKKSPTKHSAEWASTTKRLLLKSFTRTQRQFLILIKRCHQRARSLSPSTCPQLWYVG